MKWISKDYYDSIIVDDYYQATAASQQELSIFDVMDETDYKEFCWKD